MDRGLDEIWTFDDGTPMFYDRGGQPLSLAEYGALQGDADYRLLARTDVGDASVVTAWLGTHQGWLEDDEPLIFGSIVCDGPDSFRDETECFDPDEDAAMASHRRLVASLADLQ